MFLFLTMHKSVINTSVENFPYSFDFENNKILTSFGISYTFRGSNSIFDDFSFWSITPIVMQSHYDSTELILLIGPF